MHFGAASGHSSLQASLKPNLQDICLTRRSVFLREHETLATRNRAPVQSSSDPRALAFDSKKNGDIVTLSAVVSSSRRLVCSVEMYTDTCVLLRSEFPCYAFF